MANKRAGGRGITIVQGGDAGTAEGDFATCLIWCSRPGRELPCLMIVANNAWGISTPASEQHAEKEIADRCKPFGIRSAVIDGNDPEVAYRELGRAMEYVRTERRPFLIEARVSRLYGHSSASGANLVTDEPDCLALFESKLEERKILTRSAMDEKLRAQIDATLARGEQAHSRRAAASRRRHLGTRLRRPRSAARIAVAVPAPGPRSRRQERHVALMATLVQAIRLALHVGEERHGVTDVFGQDVGPPLGGVFTQTQGLRTAWNTPLDERGILGMAIGLALAGQRPIAEIQFCDYAFNSHRSHEARGRYVLVLRGRLELSHGADDARRQRHPGQHLSLALVRRTGDAHSRLEGRRPEQPGRRVRSDALGDRRPEPGDVPRAQGSHAREGGDRAAYPRRARRRSLCSRR
jgi:hypothetical protein